MTVSDIVQRHITLGAVRATPGETSAPRGLTTPDLPPTTSNAAQLSAPALDAPPVAPTPQKSFVVTWLLSLLVGIFGGSDSADLDDGAQTSSHADTSEEADAAEPDESDADGADAGIVTATYDGASNFVVNVLDADNESTGDLLVNAIGSYDGRTAFGLTSTGDASALEVTADGPWTITVAPLSSAKDLPESGEGDGVYLYDGDSGKLALSHSGEGNFVVYEETGDALSMGLLVNEIGSYSGKVALSTGPSIIAITADGSWTASVE